MLDSTATPLKALLRRRKPGYSLEAPFYTSPEIFEADMDVIFGHHWLFVGVDPDIPEPGDAMTLNIGKASIFLVRDDDGEVRAFHKEPEFEIYGQWKPRADLTVRVDLMNITDREQGYDREIHSGPRDAAPVAFREVRRTRMSPFLFVQIRKTF